MGHGFACLGDGSWFLFQRGERAGSPGIPIPRQPPVLSAGPELELASLAEIAGLHFHARGFALQLAVVFVPDSNLLSRASNCWLFGYPTRAGCAPDGGDPDARLLGDDAQPVSTAGGRPCLGRVAAASARRSAEAYARSCASVSHRRTSGLGATAAAALLGIGTAGFPTHLWQFSTRESCCGGHPRWWSDRGRDFSGWNLAGWRRRVGLAGRHCEQHSPPVQPARARLTLVCRPGHAARGLYAAMGFAATAAQRFSAFRGRFN